MCVRVHAHSRLHLVGEQRCSYEMLTGKMTRDSAEAHSPTSLASQMVSQIFTWVLAGHLSTPYFKREVLEEDPPF